MNAEGWAPIVPQWDAGARVGALMTTRGGGVSAPPWDGFNLGRGSGDAPDAVAANRARLADAIGATPVFLSQVHGVRVVRVDAAMAGAPPEQADASFTSEAGVACTVLVADCLPVLLAAPAGRAVAAAHAGWRGLAGGVIEAALAALCDAAGCAPAQVSAWLGACIGPAAFEVGGDVRTAFGPIGEPHFRPGAAPGKWWADLPELARQRLQAAGVHAMAGGAGCTYSDRTLFFSFRRDRVTGRHAAAIWIR